MELRTLQYFLAVTKEENITRAAQSLHISQPYLSKQLMDLEMELGKQLLIRGKRKITLTEDGILLRKRAEEIISLVEKTESDLTFNTNQISGEITIGGNSTNTVLEAATKLRQHHKGVHFQFYSSDATDVQERLEHGSIDFAILLQPVDITEYNVLNLPETSYWGLFMKSDDSLAKKETIKKEDIQNIPLIFHRRAGLQNLITDWAKTDINNLNIAATYNVINGSCTKFLNTNLGYFLTTRDLLENKLEPDYCFKPLDPPLTIQYALVWKRSASLSKPAQAFLEALKKELE